MNLLPYNFSNLLAKEDLFEEWASSASNEEIMEAVLFLPRSMAKEVVKRLPLSKINKALLGEILQQDALFFAFVQGTQNSHDEWSDFTGRVAEEICEHHTTFHGADWGRVLGAVSTAGKPLDGYLNVFRRKLLAVNEISSYRDSVIVQLLQPLIGTHAWAQLTEKDIADIVTWLFHPRSTEPNYHILAEIIYHPSMTAPQANKIALSPHALKEGILEHLAASPYTQGAPAVRKLILRKRSLKAFLLLLPTATEAEVIQMLRELSTSRINRDHFLVLATELLEKRSEKVNSQVESELLKHPDRGVRLEVQKRLSEVWGRRKAVASK